MVSWANLRDSAVHPPSWKGMADYLFLKSSVRLKKWCISWLVLLPVRQNRYHRPAHRREWLVCSSSSSPSHARKPEPGTQGYSCSKRWASSWTKQEPLCTWNLKLDLLDLKTAVKQMFTHNFLLRILLCNPKLRTFHRGTRSFPDRRVPCRSCDPFRVRQWLP